jgi:adenine-specific DNA-methyltransferase
MKLQLLKPAKSLNKAYFKQSLKSEQIELFKAELKKTFKHIDEKQDEEYHKNIISKLLLEVYCKDKYLVNVNKKQDLVIRNGNNTDDPVAVILEFKKPTEKRDMVSKDNSNVKALQELVLYYLRETIDKNNHEIKYLIATNIYDWFVFDGVWFENHIFNNTALKKDYKNWDVTKHGTDHFYKFIAAKHLELIEEEVPCTYFNLKEAEKILDKTELNEKEEETIINLFKILSPEHLLKLPFANDSNSLNQEFYNELLHIIGLEETKDGIKKIERKKIKDRNEGSLLENTINVLKRTKYFGYNADEETEHKYFELALELNITWLNRILFLKLLEGQLITYNSSNKLAFLNKERIKDFDELDELFFEVLAVPNGERENSVAKLFNDIPYLNSSLFELTDLEKNHQGINQLKDRLSMPFYDSTVFKDGKGKRISGEMSTLQYLFKFLDAYDFASESSAKIQKENKTVINASVLGLIFEKINGYKDGSFFTPGFITMYMCRETIHKVVVQKFNEVNKWNCKTIESVQEKIDYTDKEERAKANDIINSIKICDPAVGSGHFLVSALNALIEVKSFLKILNYRDKSRVKGFKIEIANDELIITNEETDNLFEYKLNQNGKPISELQELQEALFHEKQDLIENSLFGVDINPKSVMICRLRLWIELLKNSYYTKESKYEHLETLPNIDINIKCGNSLISRFAIDDKNSMLPKDREFVKQLIEKYKILVDGYKNALDKKAKDDYRRQIGYIKTEVEKFTFPNDKDYAQLKKKEGELMQTVMVFDPGEKERLNKLAVEVSELKKAYGEKLKTVYGNSFEWRFEFPEVLDTEGQFQGFDLVIGNPPYLSYYSRESAGLDKYEEEYFRNGYKFLIGESKKLRINTVMFFCELGFNISKPNGSLNFIVDFNILENPFYPIRKFIVNNYSIEKINAGLRVFDGVGSGQVIAFFKKDDKFKQYDFVTGLDGSAITIRKEDIDTEFFKWNSSPHETLIQKIEKDSEKLEEKLELITGVAVYASEEGKNKFIKSSKLNENYYPLLEGGSSISKSYSIPVFKSWINYDKELEKSVNKEFDEKYFAEKGSHQRPFNLRTIEDFNRPKIFIRQSDTKLTATFSEELFFGNYSLFTAYILDNDKTKLKAYLALINSKVLSFYARSKEIILIKQGKTPQVRSGQRGPIGIRQLAFKKLDNLTIINLAKLVDSILELKTKNNSADTSDIEKEIDELVYKLYNLTEEEIKIVANA